MARTQAVLKGVIHGKAIKLEDEPGLPDGQQVTVLVRPVMAPGEGITVAGPMQETRSMSGSKRCSAAASRTGRSYPDGLPDRHRHLFGPPP